MALRKSLVFCAFALLLFVGTADALRKPKRVIVEPQGILKPQRSESRQIEELNGIWKFRVAPTWDCECGFKEEWFKVPLETIGDVELMPVPSSYNDITESRALRDHVGWVWYERTFFVAAEWLDGKRRIFLRIGAANYRAIVYVNSVRVVTHEGGYLPFEVELKSTILHGDCENRITIAVDNRLKPTTLPQGTVDLSSNTTLVQTTRFEFFNYAGIHRSVLLYTTPRAYIDDIDVSTRIVGATGYVKYSIKAYTDAEESGCVMESSDLIEVKLEDKCGVVVASHTGASGEIGVPDANLWWPYTMVKNNSMAGYQYTLVITLTDRSSGKCDVYRLKVGIRSVTWSSDGFFINSKEFYFRGVGHFEEADIRGTGLDEVTIMKDHNIMKWLGSNSYRTTHYPPSEEALDVADALGIVVIEEAAAVGLCGFGSELLTVHKEHMREMIQRDKNRASIVMFSVAYDSEVTTKRAAEYFRQVIEYTKDQDHCDRPITLVPMYNVSCANDLTIEYVDVISLSRSYGFLVEAGNLDIITKSVVRDVEECARMCKKPILFAEYGIPAVAGLHRVPSFIYTEEYQMDAMREYFKAFDQLRVCEIPFIGEMYYAFADYMTKQEFWSVDGSKVGLMTRERQPKAAAHLLRQRYFLLALKLSGYPLPKDLPPFLPVYGTRFNVWTTLEGEVLVD